MEIPLLKKIRQNKTKAKPLACVPELRSVIHTSVPIQRFPCGCINILLAVISVIRDCAYTPSPPLHDWLCAFGIFDNLLQFSYFDDLKTPDTLKYMPTESIQH